MFPFQRLSKLTELSVCSGKCLRVKGNAEEFSYRNLALKCLANISSMKFMREFAINLKQMTKFDILHIV